MLSAAAIVPSAGAIAEAKAYARIEGNGEDELVARLVASAIELCEQFTGQALLARSFSQVLPASGCWTRLGVAPVRAITAVEGLSGTGDGTPLQVQDYAIDIDASGEGWVRVTRPGAERLRVSFEAGLAADWAAVPDALRHGVLRLAAHLFMERGETTSPVPAAVNALWRPWRRMRLA